MNLISLYDVDNARLLRGNTRLSMRDRLRLTLSCRRGGHLQRVLMRVLCFIKVTPNSKARTILEWCSHKNIKQGWKRKLRPRCVVAPQVIWEPNICINAYLSLYYIKAALKGEHEIMFNVTGLKRSNIDVSGSTRITKSYGNKICELNRAHASLQLCRRLRHVEQFLFFQP